MTNTKDKYAVYRKSLKDIKDEGKGLDRWTIGAAAFKELLADLDVANQLLQKVVDDTEIGCVPRSHLNRIEAYLSNPPTDKGGSQ